MEQLNLKELRGLAKSLGLRAPTTFNKEGLINCIMDYLNSRKDNRPIPALHNRAQGPIPPPRPIPLSHPILPPPPEFRPYQLRPKRGKEVFMEPPLALPIVPIACKAVQSIDPKKLKRMKKKLDELNMKIRHSKRKHNGIIHKRNSLKKVIEEFHTVGGAQGPKD